MRGLLARLGRLLGLHRDDGPVARARFVEEFPALGDRFFATASSSGKPRGLRWKSCEWEPTTAFARERSSGRLVALVGVTVGFEAIEGGDMEELPAVGMPRNATAVFFWERGAWRTMGKVVFNLNPDEVVTHFGKEYEAMPETKEP
jgi:hypothetical protein